MDKSEANGLAVQARFVRDQLPLGGLFAGQDWRISPEPFVLSADVAAELESLGRVFLQFYRAVNLLYRRSLQGKAPAWVATWLDHGKPPALLQIQRHPAFKNEVPRVIRPDLLLTEHGLAVTELDSVPGGIGVTAWLNATYSAMPRSEDRPRPQIIGGPEGTLQGFASIFGDAPRVHIVVSQEAATYRPEMQWVAEQLGAARFSVRDEHFHDFGEGDAVYRFFELFDLANVPSAARIFSRAAEKKIHLTPPPKPIHEEKLLFALLWNRHLHSFWRQELGESFLERLLKLTPYSWAVDPAPIPPHAAIPVLNLTDWMQLKALSQRERELVLKVSGFSEHAWGARGVYVGNDLSAAEWAAAVDRALAGFSTSPFVLQRFIHTKVFPAAYFDFAKNEVVPMPGRVRLCPYYFVSGQGDQARAQLGGVLATICPADKKVIHGMKEAIMAPCAV